MEQAERLYGRLIEPVQGRMRGVIGKVFRDPNDAADVFQEILVEVWSRLERIDRHPNPHAYIMRICATRCCDALRRRTRRREVKIDATAQAARAGSAGEARTDSVREPVLKAIGALPRRQARAVLLRVVEDMSYAEIGAALGCSPVTARSHVSKGLERLRRTLGALGMP